MKTHTACSCGAQHPTEVLKGEHRVIERVLDSLERLAARPRIDAALLDAALDFLAHFADGCHHAKEERELFPRLAAAGIPVEGGPIACMLDEHARGRALLRAMRDSLPGAAAGQNGARAALRAAAGEYIELLRKHIWKEDHVVFELADRVLTSFDYGALTSAFERTEASAENAGKHERYLALADRLERESRVATPEQGPNP